jgi:hypothetical protein
MARHRFLLEQEADIDPLDVDHESTSRIPRKAKRACKTVRRSRECTLDHEKAYAVRGPESKREIPFHIKESRFESLTLDGSR